MVTYGEFSGLMQQGHLVTVKEHLTLSAGVHVDHGAEVLVRMNHQNMATGGDCHGVAYSTYCFTQEALINAFRSESRVGSCWMM
jgi:hypothetical protein